MTQRRHISPAQQLFGEVLVLSIPTGTALALSDLSLSHAALSLFAVLIVAALAKYLLVYRPRSSVKEQKLTGFLDHHLDFLISDFYRRYNPDYDIRANVMRPQTQRSISYGDDNKGYTKFNYLQIAYCAGGGPDQDIPAHREGDKDETTTKWGIDQPEQGNCGRAFVTEKVRVAGRKPAETKWREQETTQDQDDATREVNSIVSVPIREPDGNKPVAVLNIDAPVRLENTNFEDEGVQQELAERYAEPIGNLL